MGVFSLSLFNRYKSIKYKYYSKCEYCGKELKPIPAKADGEPTFIGVQKCDCR